MRQAALVAACAGVCISLAGAKQPQNQPGVEPTEPAPGQPTFAPPEPNAGERPRTGDEPPMLEPKELQALPADADPETPSIPVSAIVVKYTTDHPQLPSTDDLVDTTVKLAWRDGGYVEWTPGEADPVEVNLADIALKPTAKYSSRALIAISRGLVDALNRRGIIGVTVSPSDLEFAPPEEGDPLWGKDLRPEKKNSVTLVVRVGLVGEMRTIALGERFPEANRINNPAHRHIIKNAPVKVYAEDEDAGRKDLLRRDLVEEYVFRLNRHPGRRVDIAVSAGQEPGTIALDFLVNENKPWIAYIQGSNTGTEETSEWRERFGFIHNQLTGRDDIFTLDYITAGFTESHAVIASYDVPVWDDWLRFKPYLSYNQYTASDVGFAGEDFNGEGFKLGAELVGNVWQHRETFLDLVAGVRWENVKVDNEAVDVSEKDEFFLPYFGVRLERNTDISSTYASVNIEFNLPDVAGTDKETLNELGRLNPDDSWTALQWDFSHSFYLEPVLARRAWEDPNSKFATLAHELAVSFRGQYAFDHRLIPNFEQVVGGLYTVRGYDESVVAGDTVLVGSLEYRFHLPAALGIDPNAGSLFGRPFRYRPQQPYGRADWDLILKGFVDVGRAIQSEKESFESDETLIGTGVGLEFLFKRNLSLRLDWGVALEDVEGQTESGDNRLHFVGTLLF